MLRDVAILFLKIGHKHNIGYDMFVCGSHFDLGVYNNGESWISTSDKIFIENDNEWRCVKNAK